MGGVAILARELGHTVSGSDTNVYPPMSTLLENHGIHLIEGYDPGQLVPVPDVVVIGNALSRGNACVEYVLNNGLYYQSGPQWLHDHLLQGQHVLAVSGTHGKTTTAAMLAWILEEAGMQPGFLIGGVPANFDVSARKGANQFFVVEADEYDTAFFDKRSKFIHYQPRTLIINNIEFDHADIFADIASIRREFHHLVRIIPDHGLIVARQGDAEIEQVLAMGCWTPVEFFGATDCRWQVTPLTEDGREFEILLDAEPGGIVRWDLIGRHNMYNALAAIAAASHAGVATGESCTALAGFKSVKRRMELLAEINGIRVYDDFAHHPTEIQSTLQGLRHHVGEQRIIAVMEPRSNSMLRGVHKESLAAAFADANYIMLFQPAAIQWNISDETRALSGKREVFTRTADIIERLVEVSQAGDHIIIMSNGGFEGLHQRLLDRLSLYAE